MKKILVISLMCIGLSSCALFIPVWDCVNEPYTTTYYYGGHYHRTPPPPPRNTHCHTCHTHRPRPTHTCGPSRPPHTCRPRPPHGHGRR